MDSAFFPIFAKYLKTGDKYAFLPKKFIEIVIYYDNCLLGTCDKISVFSFLIENMIIVI